MQRLPPRHAHLCDAVPVGLRAAAPETHDGVPHAGAAIAVDDRDDELRAAWNRQRRDLAIERGRRPERLRVQGRPAARRGGPGDENEDR